MKKSDLIKELFEETLKAENSVDGKEKKLHEINCYELSMILDNWKDTYEED